MPTTMAPAQPAVGTQAGRRQASRCRQPVGPSRSGGTATPVTRSRRPTVAVSGGAGDHPGALSWIPYTRPA